MNRVRAAHGLARLRFDSRLERASRFHSKNMIRTGSFAHGAFGTRMAQFRVRGSLAGENLAWGAGPFSTPAQTVAFWMRSQGHRRHILTSRFRHIGIGIATGAPVLTHGLQAATYTTDFGSR